MEKVTVIIPYYNEEKNIYSCIQSLLKQSHKSLEIIAVDDGSTDLSFSLICGIRNKYRLKNLKIIRSDHKGPGNARNLGAQKAKGGILVFVDADMVFGTDYIRNLIRPIEDGLETGTFTKDEYLQNRDNPISLCWNINRYLINKWRLDSQALTRILPTSYPDRQKVFRAVKSNFFRKNGGFRPEGYTDDWSLSEKTGVTAGVAPEALCYHKNPDTWADVFRQGFWIGKNRFLSGSLSRKLFNAVRYCLPVSILQGIRIAFIYKMPLFLIFKAVYDLAITAAILNISFSGKNNLYK